MNRLLRIASELRKLAAPPFGIYFRPDLDDKIKLDPDVPTGFTVQNDGGPKLRRKPRRPCRVTNAG